MKFNQCSLDNSNCADYSTWNRTEVKNTLDSSGFNKPESSTYTRVKLYMKEFFAPERWWAFYLGASLTAFGGVSVIQWQWWVIIVPTIVLMNVLEKEE